MASLAQPPQLDRAPAVVRLLRPLATTLALEELAADRDYFAGRMRASLAMAEAATNSIAKLIHFDLAGRYSIAAAKAGASRAKLFKA